MDEDKIKILLAILATSVTNKFRNTLFYGARH